MSMSSKRQRLGVFLSGLASVAMLGACGGDGSAEIAASDVETTGPASASPTLDAPDTSASETPAATASPTPGDMSPLVAPPVEFAESWTALFFYDCALFEAVDVSKYVDFPNAIWEINGRPNEDDGTVACTFESSDPASRLLFLNMNITEDVPDYASAEAVAEDRPVPVREIQTSAPWSFGFVSKYQDLGTERNAGSLNFVAKSPSGVETFSCTFADTFVPAKEDDSDVLMASVVPKVEAVQELCTELLSKTSYAAGTVE